MPTVSILMPTYNQANFLRRSLQSLFQQTFADWELIIINDGSTDDTARILAEYAADDRIHLVTFPENRGLGAALNAGLERATGQYIGYLPSDDVYYRDHLADLVRLLEQNPRAVLAHSGVRHTYNRTAPGQVPGHSLQLVQILHRATPLRWYERHELVTDDMGRMFLDRLLEHGEVLSIPEINCEWVDHPGQLHKLIVEPIGGINLYRQRFNVPYPMRYHTRTGNRIDEVEHFRRFRERPDTPMAADGLKILLVGELAYNSDRVLALEERGHKLYGLWMREPYWYNSVGPLPFGHVTDIPYEGWQQAVRELQPDVIYALLNWQAVPFAREVMLELREFPFVWHFKEGPFICLEKGMFSELVDLYALSDGQIYNSVEMRDWMDTVVPGISRRTPNIVLDGDLPKREWFEGERSPRIASRDDEFHTVVPGRPIGLHPADVVALRENGIHLHFYGNFTHNQWLEWIEKTKRLAPGYIHLHDNVDQENWLREFSQYDAGWLHYFESSNYGDISRANWDDMNIPARVATLAAAGLPMLQRRNEGHIVTTQNIARDLDIGLLFVGMQELRQQLSDTAAMQRIRANMWRERQRFTFDYHADDLLQFFRTVIAKKSPQMEKPGVQSFVKEIPLRR